MNQTNLRRAAKLAAKRRFNERLLQPMGAAFLFALPAVAALLLVQSNMLMLGGSPLISLAVYLLVMFFVVGPLLYGLMTYCIDRMHGGSLGPTELVAVFGDFALYRRAIKIFACVAVRAVVWIIPPILMLCGFVYTQLNADPEIMADFEKISLLISQTSVLSLVLMIPFMAMALRFLAAYILMARDASLTPWKATCQAARLFRGHTWKLTVFVGSFIGWQVAGMYTMGIGTLFYIAYLLLAFVYYTEQVLAETGESM